ncbi:hypothetical protein GJAV_G00228520 [Gymnothorax javanicus]|nr:hypothetical protein GJAV_G00228520 [Gymnothorax javanicus]
MLRLSIHRNAVRIGYICRIFFNFSVGSLNQAMTELIGDALEVGVRIDYDEGRYPSEIAVAECLLEHPAHLSQAAGVITAWPCRSEGETERPGDRERRRKDEGRRVQTHGPEPLQNISGPE